MKACDPPLTIDGLMADPLVRMVMAADRVDPAMLESLLRAVARARATASELRLAREDPPQC